MIILWNIIVLHIAVEIIQKVFLNVVKVLNLHKIIPVFIDLEFKISII